MNYFRPFEKEDKIYPLDVCSINIMGKAGILPGHKSDIMLPTAHIFEGTADNYPLNNVMDKSIFDGSDLKSF